MENILFIAYEFAPFNVAGTYRSLYFVKHLRKFELNPIVLTLSPASFSITKDEYDIDESLMREIPIDTQVHAIPSKSILALYGNKIKRFLNMYFELHNGKEAQQWKDNFNAELNLVIAKYTPKAIYVSVPPFSILKLASAAAQKYQLPLVIDFRDHWLGWRTSPFATYLHYYITKLKERAYINQAKLIIGPTPEVLDGILRFHPRLDRNKLALIYNGYENNISDWNLKSGNSPEQIIIGYVGSFYYNPNERASMLQPWYKRRFTQLLYYRTQKEDYLYRSPFYFFSALDQVFQKRPELRDKVRVQFVGAIPNWLSKMIDSFGLSGNVDLLGMKTKAECLVFQETCHYLLATSSKVIGGKAYTIGSKTYDYFCAHKPIIGFVPEGSQKDILIKSGTAIVCDPDAPKQSAEQLIQLFDNKIQFYPNSKFLSELSRFKLTEQLAKRIKSILK